MRLTLTFVIAISTVLSACANGGSDPDSESHFPCKSDADCAIRQGLPVCVAQMCASDVAICRKCTRDLTPQQGIDCYCRSHPCDADLAAALINPDWDRVDVGCNLVVVSVSGGYTGATEGFDRSGRLVSATSSSDEFSSQCISPSANLEGNAAGGVDITCSSTTTCTLMAADGGVSLGTRFPNAGPPCDVNALLSGQL